MDGKEPHSESDGGLNVCVFVIPGHDFPLHPGLLPDVLCLKLIRLASNHADREHRQWTIGSKSQAEKISYTIRSIRTTRRGWACPAEAPAIPNTIFTDGPAGMSEVQLRSLSHEAGATPIYSRVSGLASSGVRHPILPDIYFRTYFSYLQRLRSVTAIRMLVPGAFRPCQQIPFRASFFVTLPGIAWLTVQETTQLSLWPS